MSNILVLTRRELKSYFSSPVAYIVITLFLLLSGWFFSAALFLANTADLRGLFSGIRLILLFFVPAISMRLLAEEKRSGTIEILSTMPLKNWQLVLGKFIPSFILIAVTILLTLVHYFTLLLIGGPDFGASFGGYLGTLFMAGVYLSIGLFTSSMTKNQIVAFITSFVIIFVLFLMDKVVIFVPSFMATFLEFLSTDYHYENIARGVIDSRDVIYFLSLTFFFLFLTVKSLETRKWK
ncbi:MAG: ABC transporter permease subunit [candidate division Zixibacteria bacterium]|nr:ABC transporter permease subunit [candidate division Zixibacteria bacterium]